ncbi:exopolysaccharide biosynthesis polyprenyl glycosylphosphotransferase [Anaerolinea thermolimosa]|uniref:sugar transferase n=1 Tax=Anaerolinea thermolimosa TaxID=229919 RepID=UPI000781D149|nr:sugar transferase [Anaerolinea thermolimosa]GAP07544.1 exopolysaccharide biosynthesis polyprenyl glycosylphosphotransferase [Anaerolinea thermolimosa]
MFRRFSVNFALFSIVLDMMLVDAALFLAAELREPLTGYLPFLKVLEPVRLPWSLYGIFPLLWAGVLLLFSVYDGRKNFRFTDEFAGLTLGSLLATFSLAGILYLTYREVSRFLFLMATGTAYSWLLSWRLLARVVFRKNGIHSRIRQVLILGAGETGRELEKNIRDNSALGLRVVGFLDDDWQRQADHADIFGSLDVSRRVIIEHGVDDVVIALPRSEHQRLAEIVNVLHDLPVRVWVIPDYFSLTLHRAKVEEFAGIPMLDLRAPALNEYQRMVKRAFDLGVTLLLLLFALPLMGLIALLIRLDSPGPVLYRARRVGENGRIFWMMKFRTMVQGADKLQAQVIWRDDEGHILHKRPDDPRVTRVGRFLRRSSLDELPQLFNVLRGEMSLVGPRPEMPELVERYDLWQRRRFTVPQGITGWWQVNGRSDKPMHLHTDEDLYYVQNYSLWLDLKILARTVWVVLQGKGAY